MSELANWVLQWGPNPWGANSCRSIQQADLEFAKLKETAKSKLFSRRTLKCAGAWAVWLVAKSLGEENQAAQVQIQNLRAENDKLKAEIKAQRLKLEESRAREGIVAAEQVQSVFQYQEVCEQKKAILKENQALKDKLAASTKAVEEVQVAVRLLVQKMQILKEKGIDHRACEAKIEKLKAALEERHGTGTALAKSSCKGADEHWDGKRWLNADGIRSTEECKPAHTHSLEFGMPERFKVNPFSLTGAHVPVKSEGGGAEGRSKGNVQPQADRGIMGETTTAEPAPHRFKSGSTQRRSKQSAGGAWGREDKGGSGEGRGTRARENPREKRNSEMLQAAVSNGAGLQTPYLEKGRKGRWQGKRQWHHSAAPRDVVQNTVARRELSTVRVDVWRQLRKHGEDMTRWDNAPTKVLLDRLAEIRGRREGSGPRAPALPITA